MKTLVVSDQYGIFCGMNGNFACFSKDPLLASPTAYAFDSKEKAQRLVDKMSDTYKSMMDFKEIDYNENYIPLHILIKHGFKDNTGYMLDVLVSENSTMH